MSGYPCDGICPRQCPLPFSYGYPHSLLFWLCTFLFPLLCHGPGACTGILVSTLLPPLSRSDLQNNRLESIPLNHFGEDSFPVWTPLPPAAPAATPARALADPATATPADTPATLAFTRILVFAVAMTRLRMLRLNNNCLESLQNDFFAPMSQLNVL